MWKTAIVILFAAAGQLSAEDVLTVSGLGTDGAPKIDTYTMEALQDMEQVSYVTDNEFVDEPTRFSGPLLRDLLADFAAPDDGTITARALNDYAINIPMSDATDYDVIVATKRDGMEMSVREHGPTWIIYPMSQHAELRDPIYTSRLIWQLRELDVR